MVGRLAGMRRVAAVNLQACIGAIGIVGTAAFAFAFAFAIGIGAPPCLQPALAGAHEGIRAFHRPHCALGASAILLVGFSRPLLDVLPGPPVRAAALPRPVSIQPHPTAKRRQHLCAHAQHAPQRGTQAVAAQVHAHGMAQAFFGHCGA